MTDKTEVSEVVRRLVSDAGEAVGAKLAMDLKAAVPDWSAANYGCRSLSDFVVTHVPGVVVAGRSGMDVVYRPATAAASGERAGTADTLALPGDTWRTWVSPASPFALAVNAADGSTLVLKRTDEVPDGHVLVEPANAEDHRVIALDFLGHVPESAHELLRDIIESPEQRWWRHWLSEMEKLGQLSAWNSYRHDRLRRLLKTRLEAAGITEPVREAAAQAVAQGRLPRPGKARVRETRNMVGVRAIVASVIGRMSDEELRDLRLPVGLVLDVLDEKTP